MPIGERFSTSSVTVTRDPGLIRTSESRRRTEIAAAPRFAANEASSGSAAKPIADHLEAR